MATNITDDIMICPVCADVYSDPRLLHCGHHFCLHCLKQIADSAIDKEIICPTCRHITKDCPDDLSKYNLNEFQAKVAIYLNKKRGMVEKYCNFCVKQTVAVVLCQECHVFLCEDCKPNHRKMEEISGHKLFPITEHQFCRIHPEKFTQCLCEDCSRALCIMCLSDHDSHSLRDIGKDAEAARDKLRKEIINKIAVNGDKEALVFITHAKKDIMNRREELRKSAAEIRKQIATLQKRLENEEKEMNETLKAELKEIEILEKDTNDFINMKEKLIKHVTILVEKSSDAEVVSQMEAFPIYATDSVVSAIKKFSYMLPAIGFLDSIGHQIESCNITFKTCYDRKLILKSDERLSHLTVLKNFEIESGVVHGICYNAKDDTYIIRSSNAKELIQVYNTDGTMIESFGSDLEGIVDEPGNIEGISIDTKRDLFILSMIAGNIVTFTKTGALDKIIKVGDFVLLGISYSEAGDLYVTSSASMDSHAELNLKWTNSIYIINPSTEMVTQLIQYDDLFPYYVHCFSGCDENPLIVTTDGGTRDAGSRILVFKGDPEQPGIFKVDEEEVDTIQFEGAGHASLNGITTDEQGRFILCDAGGANVCTYWRDSSTDDYRQESISEDMGELEFIAFDCTRRRILVTTLGVKKVSILHEENFPFCIKE